MSTAVREVGSITLVLGELNRAWNVPELFVDDTLPLPRAYESERFGNGRPLRTQEKNSVEIRACSATSSQGVPDPVPRHVYRGSLVLP